MASGRMQRGYIAAMMTTQSNRLKTAAAFLTLTLGGACGSSDASSTDGSSSATTATGSTTVSTTSMDGANAGGNSATGSSGSTGVGGTGGAGVGGGSASTIAVNLGTSARY